MPANWYAPNLNSSYTQTSLPHHVPTRLLQTELLLDSVCVPVYLNTWSRTYHLKCTNVKIRQDISAANSCGEIVLFPYLTSPSFYLSLYQSESKDMFICNTRFF